MDLILVNPASRSGTYQALGDSLAAIENPVWAGLMATYARRHGLSVGLIDAEAEGLSPAQVADRVRDAKPRLAAGVAYRHPPPAPTPTMTTAPETATAHRRTP